MTNVTIVYHSITGHTAAQAKAVAEGAAAVEGVNVSLIPVEAVADHWDLLDDSAALVFGAPTYMGSVSAQFKAFMDESSNRWLTQRWKDKLAAGFTNAGNLSGDKLASLVQLALFAAQHSMIWVPQGVIPSGGKAFTGDPKSLNRMGSYLGAMAQSDSRSDAPAEGDLATARVFGERIALAAKRWNHG